MWKLQRPDALAVLEDRLAQRSLARYFAVMQNRKPAKFLIAKKIQANFDMSDTTEQLWQEHTKLSHEFSRIQREVDDKLIEFEAIEKPEKILHGPENRNCTQNHVLLPLMLA